MNSELSLMLQRIELEVKDLPPDEAVSILDKNIAALSRLDYRPHLVVQKAVILGSAGRLREAVERLKESIEIDGDLDSTHYFAGEYLLQLGEFGQAIDHLNKCLVIADDWYKGSAHLLRAYCAAKIGEADLARQDLDKIVDDDPMAWIDADPIISKKSILALLSARSLH